MPSLDLASEPLPLWWTTDFINASPPGAGQRRIASIFIIEVRTLVGKNKAWSFNPTKKRYL
jgi:hypothetical protein